jgi:cell division protein FtsL
LRIKSTILLILFVAFIAAPSVVTFYNHDADVSVFYSMNEEENQNGFEIESEKEVQFEEQSLTDFTRIFQKKKTASNFGYLMNFLNWHSETISPPPDTNC